MENFGYYFTVVSENKPVTEINKFLSDRRNTIHLFTHCTICIGIIFCQLQQMLYLPVSRFKENSDSRKLFVVYHLSFGNLNQNLLTLMGEGDFIPPPVGFPLITQRR